MVQESWLDTVCTTEKLKPRSAIKGTLRGVRGGENSPYSITQISSARDGAFPVDGIQPAPTGETANEPKISKHGAASFRRPNRSIRRRRERWEMGDENSVRNNSLASDETVNQ